MNPVDFILAALIAFVCGTLGKFTYANTGWLLNVVIALFGALAGLAVARYLNAPTIYDLVVQGTVFPLIYSIIGSVLFVASIGFFIRQRTS